MQNAALYPPGWIDRLTAWVERLPGPVWTFYAVLWLVLYLVLLATQWTGGTTVTFYPFHLFLAGAVSFIFGLIHYLDKTADAALDRFRPVLNCSEAEYAEMRYRLTTMPAGPTLLVTLFAVVVAGLGLIALPLEWRLRVLHFADSTSSVDYHSALSSIVWFSVVLFSYHTLHQLSEVRFIYGRARVNLFNLEPLYAFSDLSARTAIGLVAFVSAFYILVPELLTNLFSLGMGVFFTGVALLTFVWPLLGTHNLLIGEKTRFLGETAKLLEASITELNRHISSKETQGIDDWNKALSGLEAERSALSRISTWPWQTETLRSVVAALLFPVMVWLIQRILQGVLTP